MKVILILFLCPILSIAQSPKIKSTIDKFTDVKITELENPVIVKHGKVGKCLINISVVGDSSRFLSIQIVDHDFGCVFDDDAFVYFVSHNGEKYRAFNSARDCKGSVQILMTLGPAMNTGLPTYLKTNEISAIRVSNEKSTYDIDLTTIDGKRIEEAAKTLFK